MPLITDAVIQAMAYCWDETHGYQMGGDMNPDTDCSGLIWQALHDTGFSVGGSRFDTSNMGSVLISAGFTEYSYTSGFTPQHGDIFMYNEYVSPGVYNGHAFFYAESVSGYSNGYLGWENCDDTIGLLASAKVEASGTHNHPEAGDQDNGLGAHTEVWVHSYSSLTYGTHLWKVYRYGGAPAPGPFDDILFLKKIIDRNNGRTM